MSYTPCWMFGPIEGNQWGGCSLDPKKSRREPFQQIFALGIFWGGVIPYAATPMIVALSPGHSDITSFRSCSPIATRNHLDRAEKFQMLLRSLAPLTFLIRIQVFRGPLRGELPHVQIFMNDEPKQLTYASVLGMFHPEHASRRQQN
jgi:hypothetical protein